MPPIFQFKFPDLPRLPASRLPDVRSLAEVCEITSDDFSGGVGSDWCKRIAFIMDEEFMSSPLYTAFSDNFSIWICSRMALDRCGYPLYVELAFKGQGNSEMKQSAAAFFQFIKPGADSVLHQGIQLLFDRGLQGVYIPAELGHPRGYLVHQLLCRPQRMKALIVAMVGIQNPILCGHCIRSYTSNFSRNREHYLAPFHACRSIPGFMGGKCCNCIWSADASCEWGRLPGYQAPGPQYGNLIDPLGGSDRPKKSPTIGVSSLNRASCPRISCISGHTSDGEAKAMEEAKDRIDCDTERGFLPI